MPTPLPDQEFFGRHYETGTLANALAVRGALAPHTGQPYSEALLLALTGGIALGYFVFAYKGELPHLALLTRNTFDPLETVLDRLALPREVRQTTSAAQGEAHLRAALEAGHAPLVWADMLSLPYNGASRRNDYWAMQPLVVLARAGDDYWVADRARRALRVSAAALTEARGRVKQERYRLMTIDPPDPARLPAALRQALRQCLSLFSEPPPKAAAHNFGFAAYAHWAQLLTNTRHKQGWARMFPAGAPLYQALAGTPQQPGLYSWIETWTTGGQADRAVFAGALEEGAALLDRPALREAAALFRTSGEAWRRLALSALPEAVPLLRASRELLARRRAEFIEQGAEALAARQAIDARLKALRAEAAEAFPMPAAEVTDLLAELSRQVTALSALEGEGVATLQAALA
jgi:hypothetical protein